MNIIDISIPNGFECGFQSNVDFYSKKYCFKYEYRGGGKRCIIAGDDKDVFVNWFESLDKRYRKMYEMIRETDLVAEYYDIDYKIETPLDNEQQSSISHEIVADLLYARNQVYDKTISKKDIIVLSSHSSTKISLHVISLKTYFESNKIQHLFAQDVFKQLHAINATFNIDTSVYSKNRCFRMYKNHKYGKKEDLELFAPEVYNYASFEDTWVVLTYKDNKHRLMISKYDNDDLTIMQHHDLSEEITDDFKELLLDFLQKNPYFEAEFDPKKCINRLNRTNNTRRACLTDPNDFHSSENMFWYIKHHQLFVGCFCKKGHHLCLGTRKGIHKLEMSPETFRHGTHTSKDFTSYDELVSDRAHITIYDKRPTGHGKTTSAMMFSKQFQKVLIIHNRRSLDKDYIKKYPELVSYMKNTNAEKQTVCFNSLYKIDYERYDLIIIDEIRSILKQTEMADMMMSTHALFNIFENIEKPLVMLDANMTDADIKMISRFRKDEHQIVIHDDIVTTNKNVFISYGDEKTEMDILNKIDTSIKNKEKIVIIYNKSIAYMNSLIMPYKDDYRILHINTHTITAIDMDSDTWYDNYDIILYSPTISEGVSISDKRFKTVKAFGLFTSVSCPAETVSQMIARFRSIENFSIYLDDRKIKSSIPIFHKEQDVLNLLNTNIERLWTIKKGNSVHLNVKREEGQIKVIEDEFCQLYCKNKLEESLDYRNYRKTLLQKLVNNGYNIYEDFNVSISDDKKKEIAATVKELRAIENERVIKGIYQSPMISFEEYKYIKDNGNISEMDDWKMQKYNIVRSINVESEHLTTEMIEIFKKTPIRGIIRNLKQLFHFISKEDGSIERISTSIIIKENIIHQLEDLDLKTDFMQQKKSVTNLNALKLDWMNKRVMELGFKYLLSPESISIETFERNMKRVIDYYKSNYNKYADTENLFCISSSKEKHMSLNKKFITQKLLNSLSLAFGIDKQNNRVYQQINTPILMYDSNKMKPNLLGDFILPDEIIHQYDTMFMKGEKGNYCNICDVHLENGNVGFIHLNSKNHIKKLNNLLNINE